VIGRAALAFAAAVALASPACGYERIVVPTTHYHYDVGVAAIEEKDYARAIDNLRLVVKDEPRNADAHDWLGYAYAQIGDRDRSQRHYREALKLDPRHRRAHLHLGEAQLVHGDKEGARRTLDALRRLCRTPCDESIALERAIGAAR
jgi:Flp pilus assembly protein TadD